MRRRGFGGFLGASWPALVVWALCAGLLAVVAAAVGYEPFRADTWARWDSALYLDIAARGYTLFPCPPPYPHGTWCGNSGWLPGYPLLVAALHAVGVPLTGAGVVVAWLFGVGTLVLLWWTFLERRLTAPAVAALLYAALAPGQVYDFAVFPLSMLALCTLGHFWLLRRGRWLAAGLAGAVAVTAYPLGSVLIAATALWLLLPHGSTALRERCGRLAAAVVPMVVALLAVLLAQRLAVGHWNAYFLVQDKYGHSLQNPLVPVRDAAHRLLTSGTPFALGRAPDLQTVLVFAALVCVLVELAVHRRSVPAFDLLLAFWALGTWLVPMTQANVSLARSQAALLPLALLMRRLPTPLLAAFVLAALVLAIPMADLFFRGQLV